MAKPLDPYHLWLGIPPEEQPPDYYRLLGIARFEFDPDVIRQAAHRKMAHVKTFAIGMQAEVSQGILNQLAQAKVCLLDAAQRARYDFALLQKESGRGEAGTAAQPVEVAVPQRATPPPGSTQSWVIGSAPDCDIVVAQPTVSAHHCRLTRTPEGCFLEDLGSTNGTFVNQRQVTSRLAVSTRDTIRLGQTVLMPWPQVSHAYNARLIRIGAAPDNDVVFDLPTISWHHALIRVDGELTTIEDLDSTNGTALGSPENRIRRSRLSPCDMIYFGSHAAAASELLKAPICP